MTIVTDDFNRAEIGSNWTIVQGTLTISSNELQSDAVITNKLYWNANTFSDDQYSQYEVRETGWQAAICRATPYESYIKAYCAYFNLSGSLRFGWMYDSTWGAYLDSGDSGITINVGDIVRLEVSGQDTDIELKFYVDGELKATCPYDDFTDESAIINSGKPGIYLNEVYQNADNWEGGDLIISGTTCWGHSTGVEEDNTKTFTGNGSGTATISGSGDSEVLIIAPGEYWNFNTISTNGAQSNVTITLGKYVAGNTVTIKYRTGETQSECEAASFSTYSGPVSSDGFFQARLEG